MSGQEVRHSESSQNSALNTEHAWGVGTVTEGLIKDQKDRLFVRHNAAKYTCSPREGKLSEGDSS